MEIRKVAKTRKSVTMWRIVKTKVLFGLFALLPLSVWAQPEAMPMKLGPTPEGVVYFLPKTSLRFHLLVEKKTFTPGKYAKYAEKYMHLPDVQMEPQTTYNLAGLTISQAGIRDTSKCYSVKLKGGKCETAEVKLSDDGILLAVNAEPLAGKPRPRFQPAPQAAEPDIRRYIPSEILSAGSTAKQAELTAQLIYELQERRLQFITGEADDMPQDEQQLRLMIEETDRQRDMLMTLFTGNVRRDTTEYAVSLCPDGEVNRQVVFRLSQQRGLVDADDLSGIPFYMTIEDSNRTNMQKYALPDNKKEGGFYVNVPGYIRLTLYREDSLLSIFHLPMAQFGFVELRGGQLFRRYQTHMRLNPVTGAVDYLHADTDEK